VMTDAVLEPDVKAFFAERGVSVESFDATLKGIDGVVRLTSVTP